jgi:hypothetical protein
MTRDEIIAADEARRRGATALGKRVLRSNSDLAKAAQVLNGPGIASMGTAAGGGLSKSLDTVTSAREWGEHLLRHGGAIGRIAKGDVLTPMPRELEGEIERAIQGAAGRDLERVARQFGKGAAAEVAAQDDRPSRENALTATEHRRIAREHHAREYAERAAGNFAAASAHDAAANAHHRAAELASSHDSEAPFASHRAREATRNANRCCREQVSMPGHANKGAGPMDVRETRFREPYPTAAETNNPGRVSSPGKDRNEGFGYPSYSPADPRVQMMGPPAGIRASDMNWSTVDLMAAEEEREAGLRYNTDPAAPYNRLPTESLLTVAEGHRRAR